jgi:hypothetical protein
MSGRWRELEEVVAIPETCAWLLRQVKEGSAAMQGMHCGALAMASPDVATLDAGQGSVFR